MSQNITVSNNNAQQLHIAMYPWLAMGHITSFLRIANKLAEKGHKISFFLPTKTQLKVTSQKYHHELITFIPINLPSVDGLPEGAETTNDIVEGARPLLMTAMDLTKDMIEAHLINLKLNFVFFDFVHWLPELGRKHGFKTVCYFSGLIVRLANGLQYTPKAKEIIGLPPFPSPRLKLRAYETRSTVDARNHEFGGGMTLEIRVFMSLNECDAIGVKTCKEMEGGFCEYVEKYFGKPVLTAGPVLPDPILTQLDDRFDHWLAGFGSDQVVYCAFGSEAILELGPFQELVLGLELTGRPFLAALKPPTGYETIESALPEGFLERTKGRGIVYGGWVQQQLILKHPSVGCFITHCGVGSLSEAMVNKCQLVMIPHALDQFTNAKTMSLELHVGVEVDRRDEDGFFSRENVYTAVEAVMDETSEVGKEVRTNHTKWRDFILKDGVEDSYINGFIQSLRELLR